MQARALTAYPINAFTGRELVRYEWRPVPAGCEAEAERLAAAGLVELRRDGGYTSGEPPVIHHSIGSVVPNAPELGEIVVTLSVDLDSLTIVQLKDMARKRGLIGFSTMKKAELIDALRDD